MKDKEKKTLRKRLMKILKRNPACLWARNELKYLDVDEPNMKTGGIDVSGGAYAADRNYHGGYTE